MAISSSSSSCSSDSEWRFWGSTAGGINQVPSTPSAHDIAYSFLAQPTTSPQLENEDFQQMDGDDLGMKSLLRIGPQMMRMMACADKTVSSVKPNVTQAVRSQADKSGQNFTKLGLF
ncbi:hypothetical protein Tco_0001506 [Tanacetum coccineum]